jgi:soluble lytic murein transglycosylase-like protein
MTLDAQWHRLIALVVPAILCMTLAESAHAQVYVGADAPGGSIVLSNFPSQQAPNLLLPAVSERAGGEEDKPRLATRSLGKAPVRAEQLRGVIESVAQSVDIAPRLIHAVISAESNYDSQAVSPKGAVGLMQLMPATARRFGVQDPFVVQDNVLAGATYLKWLLGYFKGDIELVLAAYNAGEQAVVRAGHKVPNFPETQAYVRRIMADLRSTDSLPL